ncbi:MAG: ABC transporter permease [Actinobacteria bacterium]|nr:ABC transporter permease [Actinomycetota bacterium]
MERFVAAVTGTSVVVTILAFVSAMVVGALFIALSEEAVRESMGYFLARPGDALSAAWSVSAEAYGALFRGAVGGAYQLSETGTAAIPLILTGLAVAIPLRAGMFNIGGEGQVIAGGVVAGFVGFAVTGLPFLVHLPLAILAGILGGAAYGFLPGILKARTGAHEVITTIMLNNIAIYVTDYLLSTDRFRLEGRSDPISKTVEASAVLPRIFAGLRLHWGLLLVVVVAVAIWWLLERSTFGFELTAVGKNPDAARAAGMSTGRMIVLGLTLAGALAGLAGGAQILGLQQRITGGFSGGLGFDGITVALLGRGSVGGTVAAGVLFGALKAGGRSMQGATGTSLDLVVVLQALIILFVAAPALVRAIFRIRAQGPATGELAKGWGA